MQPNDKNNYEQDGFLGKALKVLAYPAAAFSGWWVTRNQVRHYTFMKLRNLNGLKDVIDHGEGNLKHVISNALKRVESDGSIYDIVKESRPIEEAYTKAIRDRMKSLGLDSIKAQSEFIYKPQYHKALLEGFTAASIALGGLLILANSKSLSRAFGDVEDHAKNGKDSSRGVT